jgi:flagellin-like protein
MIRHKIPGYSTRALSPIFATLILVAIVITFGTVAYYYASNVTTSATNQYANSVADTKQSISERIGFENAKFVAVDSSNPSFPPNPSPTLTVYILNCGSANLEVDAILLHIYDSNHKPVSITPYDIKSGILSAAPKYSKMININGDTQIKPLGVGQEGYFVIKLLSGTALISGQYSIQILTKSGSSFEYAL